ELKSGRAGRPGPCLGARQGREKGEAKAAEQSTAAIQTRRRHFGLLCQSCRTSGAVRITSSREPARSGGPLGHRRTAPRGDRRAQGFDREGATMWKITTASVLCAAL